MSEKYRGYGESHMTIEEMRFFVRYGDTGQWQTYFTGLALPYRKGAVWEVAHELCRAGYLMLVQRRLTHGKLDESRRTCGTFAYRACRTSKPWAEPDRRVIVKRDERIPVKKKRAQFA